MNDTINDIMNNKKSSNILNDKKAHNVVNYSFD